ncbi:MAG: CARDB domain-containing protein, partial [Cyanobacteria bacterium J06555_13]
MFSEADLSQDANAVLNSGAFPQPDSSIYGFIPVSVNRVLSAAASQVDGIDLTVLAFDVRQDHLLLGQTDIIFTLKNQGTLAARNFEVDIIYSDDDELGNSDDIVIGSFDIGRLEPDDLLTQTVSVQLPVDVLNARAQADDVPNQGAGYISNSLDFLGIQLDPSNEIAEVNETNNINTTKGRGIDDVTYFPWDIDNNGLVTPTDAIFTINRLGQSGPDIDAQADFDGNGLVSPTDAIAAINRVGYSINPEVTTPVIQAALSNDTGVSHADNITTDPTISGAIADATAVSQFKAGFDDTPTANFTDISGELLPDGRFELSANRLGEIFGNVDLPLGSHTLHLVAEDAQGNAIATLDFVFTLTTLNPERPPTPRLFLDAAELSETRSAITVDGSHHQQAFAAIKARVDQNDWRVYDENLSDGNWNYARAWLAREAAFVYLVTGKQAYAQSAFDALFAIYEDPDPDGRRPNSGNGLARAATGMGFALGYDWAASGWTQSQKDYVKGKILTALDAWPNYSYPNFAAPYGSNWVAVSRGAELVMMLSVDEERNRASRFDNLKFWLKEHLEVAYGETGLTQEGQGYLSYAGGFLMPAVYALRSIGDTELESAFTAINFEQLPLYAGVFDQAQSSLQFGVGWLGFDAEGFTSFLLDATSPEIQPYYQYFYDRHRGINSPVPDAEKFDYRRAGTVWSVLYYPTDTPAIDPSGILPVAIQDREKGSYLFRNRWQDEN